MEIRHLKLIKAVAEYKSLTRAANKLFLTQSALSHQVKEIEEEYKTRLFLRLNKQMILTTAGERLLKTAHVILEEIERNNLEMKQLAGEEVGVIRISTQCYTCYHWLSSILRQFHVKHPNIEIRIVTEATRRPLEFLEEGKLDIGIVYKVPENTSLDFQPLFNDEVVAVFRKEHPWNNLNFVTAKDFVEQTLLIYSGIYEESEIFKYLFNGSGFFPKKILKMELTEAIIELVKANMGVAILAKWAINPYLNKSELSTLPISENGYGRTWYACTLNDAGQPGYIKEFISLLKTQTHKGI